MAKKGQTVQLQTELNTDEEWEKYLQKPGLLVIDVYSDWCGPCAGMQANLKKIKVEIGGDTLQLAVAKCDGITDLERFRGTSEPTWMLVAGGKMVNFMYGANAPKLTQLITEEIRIQKLVDEGSYTRENVMEVTDRAPDEAKRWEAIQSKLAEEEALEDAKRKQEVHQRLLKESDAILENLGNLGVMVVLPHARDKYLEVMKDLMNEAGLVISISEKVNLTRDIMEEMLYFSDQKAEHLNFEDNPKKPTMGVTLKRSSEHLPGNVIDDVVLQVIYGNSRKHPGDDDSPSRKFLKTDPDDRIFIGLWAPPNARCKAIALKLLFPSLAKAYKLPEFKHVPLHVAMAFEAFKTNDLMELSKEYPGGVMRYGFFDSDEPIKAQLIAKTVEEFESRSTPVTYEEKIILQVSKEDKECFEAFLKVGPSYRSLNVEVGEKDCSFLFPPGYDAPPKKEQEVSKKSRKKKNKIIHQITVNKDGEEIIETMVADKTSTEETEELKTDIKDEGEENFDEEEDFDDEEDELILEDTEIERAGEEKATSPMVE
ncbi:uncharacterized protein LOC123312194 [Coccinella septempunctata]|uniref:uncharacterized protein LOC123312194 n=1 Tax=Coccinella septempunctata TaxID=41139 RepID=UPI001D08AA46|nr:uncharacterized protein LOC123312194 [Coccinella septempunctata]